MPTVSSKHITNKLQHRKCVRRVHVKLTHIWRSEAKKPHKRRNLISYLVDIIINNLQLTVTKNTHNRKVANERND